MTLPNGLPLIIDYFPNRKEISLLTTKTALIPLVLFWRAPLGPTPKRVGDSEVLGEVMPNLLFVNFNGAAT